MSAIELENLQQRFYDVVSTENWAILESRFAAAKNIMLIGNGGNMSIADHAAIDICRLTDKNAFCPGSGILCSSIIGDVGLQNWLSTWVGYRMRGLAPEDTLVIGYSCSSEGASSDSVTNSLEQALNCGASAALISATKKRHLRPEINNVVLDVIHYHVSEIISTMLFYQLIHSAGFSCPII